jgi:menaquinone-specific isochorismate synthase
MRPARGQGRSAVDAGVDPAASASGELRVVARTRELPELSFGAFLAGGDAPRVLWAAPDGLELVGRGAAASVRATGPDRFARVRRAASALFAEVDRDGPDAVRPRLHGGFAFDPDHAPAEPWESFPAALFVLPGVQVTRAGGTTWLTVREVGPEVDPASVAERLDDVAAAVSDLPSMSPVGAAPGVVETRRTTSQAEWTRQVERCVDRIRGGALRKVVIATSLEATLSEPVAVPAVLERLRRTYPNCFRFLVQPDDGASFFGPPPERLVGKAGRRVETEALAGSRPRGDSHEADAEFADELLGSDKLQHEQGLVVEAIRDQLAPFGDVSVGEQGIRRLSTIQHLRTPIEATLDAETHVVDLVEALHPTPAVGGLPPETARETIRATEAFDRGWYAAPVGWFDAAGDGEFAVAIRSAVASGRRATLFAGNGIVGDSDPADEWAELGPKFRPVLDELTGAE